MSVVNQPKLAGKAAFVTGGGEGIGRAIALQFAKHGASVVVSGRTESKIKETVQLIEKADGKGRSPEDEKNLRADSILP